MRTTHPHKRLLMVMAVLGVIGAAFATTASATSRVVVTGSADIRVWVDDTWDVYPSYDDVVISVNASRDCYATVFVVDTDGFVHIVRPLSPWQDAWIRGGRTYRFRGAQLGLAGLGGRGIAYVFAVSSPTPFDYSPYGETIFAGRFGLRIYGDPFIACRDIYLSLLPTSCRFDYVGVSYARFYIREWVRYPGYLCRGHGGVHVHVGDYCRHCAHIYDGYRVHAADPYPVINPRSQYKRKANEYAELERNTVKYKSVRREPVAGWTSPRTAPRTSAKGNDRSIVTRKTTRSVVSRKAVTRPTRDTKTVSRSERRVTTKTRVTKTATTKPRSSAATRSTKKVSNGAKRNPGKR